MPAIHEVATITSKGQITLPKAVVSRVQAADYFEVSAENGRIVLTPAARMVTISRLRAIALSASRVPSSTAGGTAVTRSAGTRSAP